MTPEELAAVPARLSARFAELAIRPEAPFKQPELIIGALTHSSYASEHGGESNERLEMLGDAVLGFAVTELLFHLFPDEQEGGLTRLRASLVDETMLARKSRELGLGSFLAMGRGEAKSGGHDRDSALADAFEALVAAIYLSEGFPALAALTDQLFRPEAMLRGATHQPADFKTTLQVRTQAEWKAQPNYRIVAEDGPPHDRTFRSEVRIGKVLGGQGEGKSKKLAEQQAASAALDRWAEIAAEFASLE